MEEIHVAVEHTGLKQKLGSFKAQQFSAKKLIEYDRLAYLHVQISNGICLLIQPTKIGDCFPNDAACSFKSYIWLVL